MFLEYLQIKYLTAGTGRGENPTTHLLSIEKLLTFVSPFSTLNSNKLGTQLSQYKLRQDLRAPGI